MNFHGCFNLKAVYMVLQTDLREKYSKKDVTYFFKRPRMVECVSTGRDKDVQQKTGQINSPLQAEKWGLQPDGIIG